MNSLFPDPAGHAAQKKVVGNFSMYGCKPWPVGQCVGVSPQAVPLIELQTIDIYCRKKEERQKIYSYEHKMKQIQIEQNQSSTNSPMKVVL